jgi:hypothetical protein
LKEQGFAYLPNYITEEDQTTMITELDNGNWRQDLGDFFNFLLFYLFILFYANYLFLSI